MIYQNYLSQDQNQEVPLAEAVTQWCDNYYNVVIAAINRLGIRRNFPGHTDGDIYMRVWMHRGSLFEQKGQSSEKILQRLIKNMTPEDLSAGPPPGKWSERISTIERHRERLFGYILVSLDHAENRTLALEQALIIARANWTDLMVATLSHPPGGKHTDDEVLRASQIPILVCR